MTSAQIQAVKVLYACCAQDVYDNWHQDEDGHCEEFACGGICDRIADEVFDSLQDAGYEELRIVNEEDPNHAYVGILDGKHWRNFDIHYSWYEYYLGPYRFEKIPNVKLTADMVSYWVDG
jgi:hypothetical protein